MRFTIRISKVVGSQSLFVVGATLPTRSDIDQMFYYLRNVYSITPTYSDNDFLVDLYHDDDLVDTFVTDTKGAREIDKRHFASV